MDYRIEKRDAFQVVCKRKKVSKPQSANAAHDITSMWQEYGADGTMERLIACMPENPVMSAMVAVSSPLAFMLRANSMMAAARPAASPSLRPRSNPTFLQRNCQFFAKKYVCPCITLGIGIL